MSGDDLLVQVADGIATITLNRPSKRNAVTYDMWMGLTQACADFAHDSDVRLLVIRGAGDHFCAGADVSGLGGTSAADYAACNVAADQALATFPKPTVALITGSCVGGGAQIATSCDIRIADTTARFGITPARLGILYPPVALERTVHLVGPSATRHLLYSAEIFDAERALRIGLIDELHEPSDAADRLDQLSARLVGERSLLTQMASKEMIDDVVRLGRVSDETVARWDAALAESDDAREGIHAFLEKRTPRFTWTPS